MKLYSEYARVYHDLYPLITDYRADFEIYDAILGEHDCVKILELGCGTGLYATYFVGAGYEYVGVDLSRDMLAIAREFVPSATFEQGDICSWGQADHAGTFDAIIAPGNTFGHLITNTAVFACLSNVHTLLRPDGVFIFDALDTITEFGNFCETYAYAVENNTTSYHVNATFTPCYDRGWVYKWETRYTVTTGDTEQQFNDSAIVRTFFPAELQLMLQQVGFKVLSCTIKEGDSPVIMTQTQKQQ